MPLDRYRDKRHFDRTPEPAGSHESGAPSSAGGSFVVQKHAARQLHYDFRLEMNGVLVSWAVPKGPSLDPHDKRLAVHVEDHPIEYGGFEGAIPAGEYGGGTVMLWDRGTWEPLGDKPLHDQMATGQLKFALCGEKLVGAWTLVRMKSRPGEHAENWLLIKERDEYARPRDEYDVLVEHPDSVATGRDLAAIAADAATAPATEAEPRADGSDSGKPAPTPAAGVTGVAGAVRGVMPVEAGVQLATLVDRPPDGPEWLHEVKYDGYRLRLAIEDGRARLLTRTGQDWTERFSAIAEAAATLPVSSALLDGEAVVFGRDGVPDFGALQRALAEKSPSGIVYVAFDLLYLDGWDLRGVPLRRRKELLHALVSGADAISPIRYADHIEGHGPEFHASACTLALEGSVSKRGDRPYREGRTRDWLKVKCLLRQEFVIAGYTEPRTMTRGVGALLLGVHDDEGELRYAGRVGTGWTAAESLALRERLEKLRVPGPRIAGKLPRIGDATVHWVRPELVAEVAFQEWTRDGAVRHGSFKGLREDIDAAAVAVEAAETATPEPPATPEPQSAPGSASRAATTVAGVRITNPEKILTGDVGPGAEARPDSGPDVTSVAPTRTARGIRKIDLARYFEAVAEPMLRFAGNRPLTLVRCPHGTDGDGHCFYQKHPDLHGTPRQLKTVEVTEKGHPATYIYADSAGGLVALAQMGALEIHTWNSRVDDPEHPDQIVFDLDPGEGVDWERVVVSARILRDVLGVLGLASYPKTTGGKGLHLVVPISPTVSHEDARVFAHAVVDRLAAHDPAAFTSNMSKAERGGRIFIDYLRNAHGATAVAAFSTRARPGIPVAVPIAWDELDADLDPLAFDTTTVPARLKAIGSADPWAGFELERGDLTETLFRALGARRT